MNSRLQCKIGLFVGALFIGSSAWAVGFESSIPFGARTAGSAGIATPDISGAQSLFFNPAGLVGQKGQQVSLQDSPSWAEVKAPIDDQNDISKTSTFAPPGGLFYSYAPNNKWGFGAGYYVAGGNSISFDGLNINSGIYNGTAKDSVELKLMEFSLGAGYQVNDKLKVGIAWRAMFANASFASVQRSAGNTLANAQVDNLAGHSLKGFRVGAQYEVSQNTRIGLTYRSPMDVRTKGNFAGQILTAGPTLPIDQTHAEVATTLPQAINLGVAHRLSDTWKIMGEYDWLNYSHVDHITIDGKVTRSGGTLVAADASDMTTNWSDQHEIRIAAEYTGWKMPFRFGYVWSSRVTNEDYAKPTTTPPGMGHALTAGTSYKVGSFDLDGAVEYSMVQANVSGAKAGQTGPGNDLRDGKYSLSSIGAHLGVTYSF